MPGASLELNRIRDRALQGGVRRARALQQPARGRRRPRRRLTATDSAGWAPERTPKPGRSPWRQRHRLFHVARSGARLGVRGQRPFLVGGWSGPATCRLRLVSKKVNSTADLLTSRFLVRICTYYVERNTMNDMTRKRSTARHRRIVAQHGAGGLNPPPILETDMWRSSLGSRCVCKTATKLYGDIGVDPPRDRAMLILSMMGGAGIRGGF